MRSTPQSEERRLERLAKNMIVSRDIPPAKMEAVKALLDNPVLDSREKFTTIIELIRPCPDKRPVQVSDSPPLRVQNSNKSRPQQIKKPQVSQYQTTTPAYPVQLPGSDYVDAIFTARKAHGLFQKRRLIHAHNLIGFWFRKRLVPSQKFFRVFDKISFYQELILLRLPDILQSIVEDPQIEDPTAYNYLKLLGKWLMNVPFVKLGYERARWLDIPAFEAELKTYCTNYLLFERIDTIRKEQILSLVEDKLRQSDELKKIPAMNAEAENLKKEKKIHEYLMTLRSFMPTPGASHGIVDTWLKTYCEVDSLGDFLTYAVEALVFRRSVGAIEIYGAWNLHTLNVSPVTWNCGDDILKKAGKDEISLRFRRIEALKNSLEPYDQILDMINIKVDGRPLLEKAFEEHWHIISKRRSDYADYYKNNFFYFLDECFDYFIHAYVPFIDGSPFLFMTPERKIVEASVFSAGYFEARLSALYDLQGQLLEYRTLNPNQLISYDEVRRIMSGRLSTMVHIKVFVEHIGAIFYAFACDLFAVYRSHFRWLHSVQAGGDTAVARTALVSGAIDLSESDSGTPLPFHDSLIARSENMTPILRTFVGKRVMSDSIQTGIFKLVTAFCYQMAAECMHPALENELEKRREIKNQIALYADHH